jgi:transporter family-2 protein
VYVVIIIVLLPRLGTATVIALFVLGQMIASLAFDNFGVFGVPKHPADMTRIAGALLLVAGVFLIRR